MTRSATSFRYLDDRLFHRLREMPDEELQEFAHALGEIVKQSGFKPREIENMLARGKSLADAFAAVAVRVRRQRVRKTDDGESQ